MSSQSPASVPFDGLFSSPMILALGLFSSLMILALTTFLFLLVSSTPHSQNPFCNHKPEPSFIGVTINKTCV